MTAEKGVTEANWKTCISLLTQPAGSRKRSWRAGETQLTKAEAFLGKGHLRLQVHRLTLQVFLPSVQSSVNHMHCSFGSWGAIPVLEVQLLLLPDIF